MFLFLYYIKPRRYASDKPNRIHDAVCLFSNRSQMMSKCGKNLSDTVGYRLVLLVCHSFVLQRFDVLCDLLLNRRTAKSNLFVY